MRKVAWGGNDDACEKLLMRQGKVNGHYPTDGETTQDKFRQGEMAHELVQILRVLIQSVFPRRAVRTTHTTDIVGNEIGYLHGDP